MFAAAATAVLAAAAAAAVFAAAAALFLRQLRCLQVGLRLPSNIVEFIKGYELHPLSCSSDSSDKEKGAAAAAAVAARLQQQQQRHCRNSKCILIKSARFRLRCSNSKLQTSAAAAAA
ncbi:hypothetical protein Emag_007031 [Eimeria magna]